MVRCFAENLVYNANNLDSDQTPRSVASSASDEGLYCLPMPFLGDTRHKWSKNNGYTFKVANCCFFPFLKGV